jgi:hypothetical protein
MLPSSLKADLRDHLKKVKLQHEADLRAGHGRVYLPNALSRKYLSTRLQISPPSTLKIPPSPVRSAPVESRRFAGTGDAVPVVALGRGRRGRRVAGGRPEVPPPQVPFQGSTAASSAWAVKGSLRVSRPALRFSLSR